MNDSKVDEADAPLLAKLTTALGRVDQGSAGGYNFRRHIARTDLLPLVKVLIAEAEAKARGVEWAAVEALQAAQRAVAGIEHGTGSAERVLGRKSMQTEVALAIDALQKQARRGVEWTVQS